MAVSVTTGVLSPLLGKLTKLLSDEDKNLTGLREQASFLRDELLAIKAPLEKLELIDKLDPSDKDWRDHVREMSYDMENCIDDFMRDVEVVDAKGDSVMKMIKLLRRLVTSHHIANRVEELKILAVESNTLRERYTIDDDDINPSHASVVVDPRISAIYMDAEGLVGMDGPREELISLLTGPQKELKVVFIVGPGGLGKTTLAMKVWYEIERQFDCTTFVSVSQRPDVESLLSLLLSNLGVREFTRTVELHKIIDLLRECLEHERYFILIDDLWDQSSWNIIRRAFPENSNGSRLIVTTRLDDVAVNACQNDHACIYIMKPLEERDSRRLFFKRVFEYENECPPQFQDISAEILKKCGGLPLAIITIASLLAHEAGSLNEWKSINNSFGVKFSTKSTLEEMMGILNLSYMHLPILLRPCLLYLGMYPEDCEIWKGDLVKQWVAERFICSMNGVDLYDAAESCFSELINRSLIMPERREYGEIVSCRVHDMVRDLILSKCFEDNFISLAYKYEDMERLHSSEHKVCRLSLSDGGAELETLATSMSQVRSYAQFRVSRYTPPLSDFKYLGMLLFVFLFGWERTVDLTAIAHLFLLKYLKVSAPMTRVALPIEIQGLVHLETLELDCYATQSFPSDISRLVNMFHLILPDGAVVPKGIEKMKSVLTLHCSGMSESSVEDIKGLSELTSLEELELSAPGRQCLTVERVAALVSSIGLLRHLKRLTLDCDIECDDYERLSEALSDPPPRIEVLDLENWKCSRVPRWIGELRCLRFLHLSVLHLSSDEFRVLGELPLLVSAEFHVLDVSQHKVVVGTGLFPVLKEVSFRSYEDVSTFLSFEAGAMPKLQKLTLLFGWEEWRGTTPVGMERLPCLHGICVWLGQAKITSAESSKSEEDVRAHVESAFKSAVRLHPKHPSVTVFD